MDARAAAIIITGFLAALMIIWQVGRQARSAINLQQEASRQSLKVDVYRSFDIILTAASTSSNNAGSDAQMLSFNLRNALNLSRNGILPYSVKHPAELCSDNNSKLNESVSQVLILLERFQIINSRLDLFNFAISSASHDIREAFIAMWTEILRFVPTKAYFDKAAAAGFNLQIPNDEDLRQLDHFIASYNDAVHTYGCYIHDLNIALQNELLGSLFNNVVPARQPLSNKYRTITLDPASYEDIKNTSGSKTESGQGWSKRGREFSVEEAIHQRNTPK